MSILDLRQSDLPLRILKGLEDHPDFFHIREHSYFSNDVLLLNSPLFLPDIERGVLNLRNEIDNGGHIFLLGDRDVDGISSTAILANLLTDIHVKKGGKLTVRVSDDGDDYGLCGSRMNEVIDTRPDLLILLDMGTSNGKEILKLIDLNIKVIIIDHHLLGENIPPDNLCAFINPMRVNENIKMSTASLMFYFVLAFSLLYTDEWKKFYIVEKGFPAQFHVFRLGCYLGCFNSEEELSEYLKNNELCEYNNAINIKLNSHLYEYFNRIYGHINKKYISNIWEEVGKYLLSYCIASKPRLCSLLKEVGEIASLGIIADMVPLREENRTIVRFALHLNRIGSETHIREGGNTGYRALFQKIGISEKLVRSRDIGWSISPVLNAPGRLGKSYLALNLLLNRDKNLSNQLAEEILNLNIHRKERSRFNEELAMRILSEAGENSNCLIIFIYHPDFHSGVSGIVATRLVEAYNKTVVFINPEGRYAKGSIRTDGKMNALEFITQASSILKQYGGHREAAGFSIEYENIDQLKLILCNSAHGFVKRGSNDNFEKREYHLLVPADQIGCRLLEELDLLEPFGMGNPEPILKLQNVTVKKIVLLSEGRHARFFIEETKSEIPFLFWNIRDNFSSIKKGTLLNCLGVLEWNYFRGKISPQFRVSSIQKISANM